MPDIKTIFRSYRFSVILILSVILGAVIGLFFGKSAAIMKPLGDVFLNLLFTAIVPLVFFSIASAVSGMPNVRRLGRILFCMIAIFIITGIIASIIMVICVQLYPPAEGAAIDLGTKVHIDHFKTSEQIVRAFTASDFTEVLSKRNMLALIIFSILVGLGCAAAGEKGRIFSGFLASGNEVMMKVISFIMYYAPVGLCAYFAHFIGTYGTDLLNVYFRGMALYYPVAVLYFFIAFSLYAYAAARGPGVRRFWKNIVPASLTALATGSSIATIPCNLDAADRIGIPRDVSEVVIPIGATIHMDGSCLGSILKIAFLFGIFNMNFNDPMTMLIAVGIAILSGTVITGIPSGGVIGEILIISLYGFPPEALPIISMIGALIDPPATMINAVGDNVASMVVARMVNGKTWLQEPIGGQ
jgi:Na+/H+-dicarboxylate symporter